MEPTDANLRAWDEVRGAVPPPAIPDPVRALLPDLGGRHVLQLLCATGELQLLLPLCISVESS